VRALNRAAMMAVIYEAAAGAGSPPVVDDPQPPFEILQSCPTAQPRLSRCASD
jgi:hypothetical protein